MRDEEEMAGHVAVESGLKVADKEEMFGQVAGEGRL